MKVKIRGYQSVLNETEIEIKGLTIITGESNIGKSSLVRAIIGALQNQKGNWFISKDADDLVVTIENEGHAVTWLKSDKTSAYEVDGSSHRKAGRSTPVEEIAKLGFFEVRAQDRQYLPQIQKQFAPPFIIAESSPVAAAELLAASKEGQKLGKAVKLAQRDQANKSAEILIREESLEGLNLLLKETEKFKGKIETGKQKIVDSEGKLQLLTEKHTKFRSLREALNLIEEKLSALESCPLTKLSEVPSAGKLPILKSHLGRLQEVERRLKATNESAKLPPLSKVPLEQGEKLEKLRTLKRDYAQNSFQRETLAVVDKPLSTIERSYLIEKRMLSMRKLEEEYQQRLGEEGRLEEQLQQVIQEKEKLDFDIEQTLTALGRCPMCGQETKESHIHPNGQKRIYAPA